MFVVCDLCLDIANWNERVKCHWGELFTQFLFCSKFVLHASVIFILLVSSVSLHILTYIYLSYGYTMWTQLKIENLVCYLSFSLRRCFISLSTHQLIIHWLPAPSRIKPLSSLYTIKYCTGLCRNSHFVFPVSLFFFKF